MEYEESLPLLASHIKYNYLILTNTKKVPKEVFAFLEYLFRINCIKDKIVLINYDIKDNIRLAITKAVDTLSINEKNVKYIYKCLDKFFEVIKKSKSLSFNETMMTRANVYENIIEYEPIE